MKTCSNALLKIETNGVKIDQNFLESYSKELRCELISFKNKHIKLLREFNLDSPSSYLKFFSINLDYQFLRNSKRTAFHQRGNLVRLSEEYELPKVILEYRGLAKLKSTYTDSLVKMIHNQTKRVHTSYQQAVTSTGSFLQLNQTFKTFPLRQKKVERSDRLSLQNQAI